ncbi:hypothetical protein [Bacillus coahuilensis]|uniref:hypothetical protein n=1 Tax=Bacillus coahuilensis TaxID=408580 RepID=UPI000A7A8927|nr:hypothetical protein [Bacillus coahuilensis]
MKQLYFTVKNSLWLIPGLYSLLGLFIALISIYFDIYVLKGTSHSTVKGHIIYLE